MNSPDLARAKQQEVRAQILKCLDRERPRQVAESIVLRSLHQSGIPLGREALGQELSYLEAKALVAHTEVLWRLLPLGVDVLEHNVPDIPGIPVNGALSPETLAYRQEVRGRLLMALYFARPHGATAALLWRALDDSDLPVSDKELSREAAYLAGKNLIAIEGEVTAGGWSAVLTATGVDVMEYSITAPAGIRLIDKYWEG
ncbi:MAG: hypothetical protein KME14_20430 [Tildeniella torsiva UHER 1998/13D]|jgi:hypothetical protein|nr:hypothetical protein [Tildeniella torsiva UHER 1998/13D]